MDARLAGILLVTFVIRLGWSMHLPVDPQSLDRLPDQREYLELGRNLLSHQGLYFYDPRFGDTVYAYRMPGYPFFIALCHGNIRIVRIAQAALDVLSALGVYCLARLFMGYGGALLAAGIVAVDPFLVYFSGLILSETLFISMLVWGMVLLVNPHRKWPIWVGGIVLLTLSIMVRPSAIGLPLVLGIAAMFVRAEISAASRIPVGLLTVIICFCTLLHWAWRNEHVLGKWIWSTTNTGITFYDGLNPDATGASDQSFTLAIPQLRDMSETARSEYLGRLAWQFVRDHPIRTIQLTVAKVARTWSPIPLSAEFGSDWKLVGVAMAFSVPLDVLIILGLWLGRAPRSVKVFLTAPAVYLTLVHAVSVGSLRYRIPADVPMAVVAGTVFQGFRVRALAMKNPLNPES